MKKWLMKIMDWDHTPQVFHILGSIPAIIAWCRGHVVPLALFVVGFNFGAALYWQYYLAQRKRTEEWMEIAEEWAKRATRPRNSELEEMLDVAKGLVEARMKAAHIDPDKN